MAFGLLKAACTRWAQSMERLFLELGGKVIYNADVKEVLIADQKAYGIQLADEEIDSDFVICNADFPYAMKNLIKDKKAKGKYTDKKIDSMKYSCSCFVMYLGTDVGEEF